MTLEAWREAGLFDPDHPDADVHRTHIEWLESVGVAATDLGFVSRPEDLLLNANRRLFRPGARLTVAEAIERAGMTEGDFATIARATGYPMIDEVGFTEDDLAAFEAFGLADGLFTTDELLHFTRVMSSSLGRIAEASTALFRVDIGADLEAAGTDALGWAKKNHEAAQLITGLQQVMWSLFRLQLELAGRRSDEARDAVGEGRATLRLAVGFVDLVGYTPIADTLELDELGNFMRRFEEQAYEIVTANGGRVVKLIGDEVMFIGVDPNAACASAASLIEAFAATSATPRGGLVYGDVVARGGDYYGRIVNLASRAAGAAVPGELLVDADTAAACTDFAFEPAGRRQLKGFADPVRLFSHDSSGGT